MKTLITGGAGFIGSHMCDYLIAKGHEIVCLDNLSSGNKRNISHLLENPNFTFIKGDVVTFNENIPNIDYIYHMASIASPDYYQKEPIATIDANTIGTKNMLELATKQKVKSLVYTSTSECYGDSKIVPTPEVYWGNVNPNGIRSCYDEGKRCGEAYCLSFFRKYKTPVRIARIFNTYGPRLSAKEGSSYGRVIPRFIEQSLLNKDITIFGDGSQTRSFCYISDQINGLYKLLTVPNIDGEVINIGNTNEMTILQLAKSIIKLTNSSSNIVFTELPADDPKRRCADIRKAKKMLGWLPEVSLENGLTKTIDWFKNQVKT